MHHSDFDEISLEQWVNRLSKELKMNDPLSYSFDVAPDFSFQPLKENNPLTLNLKKSFPFFSSYSLLPPSFSLFLAVLEPKQPLFLWDDNQIKPLNSPSPLPAPHFNASRFFNAGFAPINELALILYYWSQLPHPAIIIAVGTLFPIDIARLIALRLLLVEYSGWKKETFNPQIIAITSLRNKTVDEPHHNQLRLVSEQMAAFLGMADLIISIPPILEPKTENEARKALRLNENINHLLGFESHFFDTQNPLEGNHVINNLAVKLAELSWEKFRLFSSLNLGYLQNSIPQSLEKELKKDQSFLLSLHQDSFPLLGINLFSEKSLQIKHSSFPNWGYEWGFFQLQSQLTKK